MSIWWIVDITTFDIHRHMPNTKYLCYLLTLLNKYVLLWKQSSAPSLCGSCGSWWWQKKNWCNKFALPALPPRYLVRMQRKSTTWCARSVIKNTRDHCKGWAFSGLFACQTIEKEPLCLNILRVGHHSVTFCVITPHLKSEEWLWRVT